MIRLLENPGIIISNTDVLNLFADAGANVNLNSKAASIPEELIHNALGNCQSPEKLILDSAMIASFKHFSKGIQFREDPRGIDLFREVGTSGDFISHEHTFKWFKDEVHYPSQVIDR